MTAFKKKTGFYLKYPLMWVMLLWAVTLPGHEVAVYNFLLKLATGMADASLERVQEEIILAGKQGRNSHVFLDAAPPAFTGKMQFPATPVLPAIFVLSLFRYKLRFSAPVNVLCVRAVHKKLLVSVLPNAP